MAELSFRGFFFLVLVLSVVSMVPLAKAVGRCQDVLHPNICLLATCRQQCARKHNGNAVCVSRAFGKYSCVCYYNCWVMWLPHVVPLLFLFLKLLVFQITWRGEKLASHAASSLYIVSKTWKKPKRYISLSVSTVLTSVVALKYDES